MRSEPMPPAVAAVLTSLVLGLTASAEATDTRATGRPILKLAGTAPLGIEGRGFVAGEVVRLVAVTAELRRTRTAIASSKGFLRIRFELQVSRCTELTVRATGSLGSRAVLHRNGRCKQPGPPKDRGKR